MTKDLINTTFLALAFLSLFAVGELLYHKFKVKAEVTRKIVHIGTGVLSLFFPIMLGNHWLVLLLCASFAIILLISLRTLHLQSINSIDRKSYGSLLYPLSVYLCYLVYDYLDQNYLYYYLPILILAISDPIAAIAGKRWASPKYNIGNDSKTIAGNIGFLVSAYIISIIIIRSNYEIIVYKIILASFLISIISTVAEGLSVRGKDNLSIPVSVIFALYLSEKLIF